MFHVCTLVLPASRRRNRHSDPPANPEDADGMGLIGRFSQALPEQALCRNPLSWGDI
jgi:hypothetical protein